MLEKCPICGAVTRRRFEKYGYWIRECSSCTHRYVEGVRDATHLENVYGDDYFTGGGAGYSDYLAESELLRERGRKYGQLVSQYVSPPGTLLDVGAAAGVVLQGWQEVGWKGCGIEPNHNMAKYARETVGVDVVAGSLETYSSETQFDLVSMIQVIAHVYDLQKALSRAKALTKPGGFWLIETWDSQSWSARIFGQNWHEYSPPSVLHLFSRRSLRHLCRNLGFEEIATGRPNRWIKGSHVRSLLQHKLQDMPGGRWLVPWVSLIPQRLSLPYWGDDLFWVLLRHTGP